MDDGLYPPVEPYEEALLQRDGHQLYYELSGNPSGPTALFLHGGPGGGTYPRVRRFFDPAHYRIVLLDQRGSGKSIPNVSDDYEAALRDNTTGHLVDDIEALTETQQQALFHLYNRLIAGGSLLLVSREPLSRMVVSTPDLRSRLRAVPVAGEWWLSTVTPTEGKVIAVTSAEHFFGGALTTAMFAFMMSRVDRQIGATHYTVLAAIEVGHDDGVATSDYRVLYDDGDEQCEPLGSRMPFRWVSDRVLERLPSAASPGSSTAAAPMSS